MIAYEDVSAAAARIASGLIETPLLPAPAISELCGADVYVKYENMQATGSFKERGALNKLLLLSPEARARGVVAMSAGNHALALAYHAARLGAPATAVMPQGTPAIKVENARRYGARVVLEGTLEDAERLCHRLEAQEGLTFVHPYDDADVIAGQGSVALEILDAMPGVSTIVAPIGGGGLIAGMAIAAHARAPQARIIGVQTEAYSSFRNALHGKPPPLGGATLAEGIAVRKTGVLTLPIVEALASDIAVVSETDLERAVAFFAVKLHTMAEGAGAAALAAVLADPARFRGGCVVIVLSGGNIDPRILSEVMMRDLEREDRIVSFRVAVNDRPGLLGTIATRLGESGANILEVSHRRLLLDLPARGVSLHVTMETRDRAHAEAILAALRRDGLCPHRAPFAREDEILD